MQPDTCHLLFLPSTSFVLFHLNYHSTPVPVVMFGPIPFHSKGIWDKCCKPCPSSPDTCWVPSSLLSHLSTQIQPVVPESFLSLYINHFRSWLSSRKKELSQFITICRRRSIGTLYLRLQEQDKVPSLFFAFPKLCKFLRWPHD
ncbi:hypothetical protein J5N97_004547 [Dioscorea zingiberensis]|uniref:Uncharacterized protein n=1 Tax=Dioscorea zingiberensis TaxID=325984 RepID=A0A9D5HRX3_9LILI|nr:hypothetical protein J5N97_004547 [Dioscorea zingiberensis]